MSFFTCCMFYPLNCYIFPVSCYINTVFSTTDLYSTRELFSKPYPAYLNTCHDFATELALKTCYPQPLFSLCLQMFAQASSIPWEPCNLFTNCHTYAYLIGSDRKQRPQASFIFCQRESAAMALLNVTGMGLSPRWNLQKGTLLA